MLNILRQLLRETEKVTVHTEESDHEYTRFYTELLRKRRFLKRRIRRAEKLGRQVNRRIYLL